MAKNELKETLLEKHYYENCPGCKVDQRKELQQGLPIKELLSIWTIVLCTALPISSLFPFLYFMIRDFHIAKREEDIGYYAGYVGKLTPLYVLQLMTFLIFFRIYMNFPHHQAYASEVFSENYQALGLSTVSTSWGIGLIIGPALGGFLAQVILLWSCKSVYACSIGSRMEFVFLKSTLKRDAENVRFLYKPDGESWLVVLNFCQMRPAEKFPALFSSTSIFGRFPYFLPCLAISVFALVVTIASFWLPSVSQDTKYGSICLSRTNSFIMLTMRIVLSLTSFVICFGKLQETLHMHNIKSVSCDDLYGNLEAASCGSEGDKKELEERESTSIGSLVTNWPLMSSILVYCVFSLHDMAYTEVGFNIFSLWAVSPRKFGGLSYTTESVGEVLAIS
ncbi:hypothetical protein RJ639_010674, partial [Escallonia herrerae]